MADSLHNDRQQLSRSPPQGTVPRRFRLLEPACVECAARHGDRIVNQAHGTASASAGGGRRSAEFAGSLILSGRFDDFTAESSLHHFTPNKSLNKFELLKAFKRALGASVEVKPAEAKCAVDMTLKSNSNKLTEFFGKDLDVADAIVEMLEPIGAETAAAR